MSLKNRCPAWMFSRSLTKHLSSFSSGFTKLHAKLDADMLLDFAIHRRQNKTWSQKSKKNSACSQHGVTWQTDAVGFQKCDLGLPSSFTDAVTTMTVPELSDTTSYIACLPYTHGHNWLYMQAAEEKAFTQSKNHPTSGLPRTDNS
jgi:hypothetical protein